MDDVFELDQERQKNSKNKGIAIACFVVGIVGVCISFLPIINLINIPVQITGFILGLKSKKNPGKGFAMAGMILSPIAIILSILILSFTFSFNDINRFVTKYLDKSGYVMSDNDIYKNGGIEFICKSKNGKISDFEFETMKKVLIYRMENKGIFKRSIKIDDVGNIVIKFESNASDEGKLTNITSELFGKGELTFQEVDENVKDDKGVYKPTGKIIITSFDVTNASVEVEKGSNYNIGIELSEEGSKRFGEATQRLIGKPIGIFIDKKMLTAPNVVVPITDGRVMLTGQKDEKQATDLATLIKSGALPFDIDVVSQRIVAPVK